ncbi:hypothetical protein [Lachnoclostridium sp. MSJ-17]|uniref:hypothetical protein n=1 Tax=Lachnoclostridium sp. MSJ-17 TaxID=2841516 RepID=UPI001C0F9D43|nr:hypothetical protein [Lachnoclostridium sp. MSJ-17]MBU5462729.1 hypothetical protein [Lachnoclostridium sp. MSJ-17]
MDFYSRYSWNVTTDNLLTTYEYVATNYQTTPGDEYAEIAINKEWVDDGEQEYRKAKQSRST